MESLLSLPTENAAALTRADIVCWWEARRLRFNLYVGAVGVVSWFLVLIAGSAAVKPGVDFEEPLAMIFGPLVYAFMANVCSTLGWVVDTVALRGVPRTRFYRLGVVFISGSDRIARRLGCGRMPDNRGHRPEARLITVETSSITITTGLSVVLRIDARGFVWQPWPDASASPFQPNAGAP